MKQNIKETARLPVPVIKAEGINFSYRSGDPILKNVGLEVNAGDFYGIIGPNGSGKTTLVRILLGMLAPDSGTVRLWGKSPAAAVASGRVSYVSQRATHFDRNFPATVLEVVVSGRAGKPSASGAAGRAAATGALREVGMEKYADRKIGELSSGQQQRVLIARALASEPELIFFDEPTLGVDVATETEFYDLLKYLNEKKKLTLVIVTHDLDIIGHKVNKLMCLHCSVRGSDEPGKLLEGEALHLAAERGIRLVSHEENGTHHHDFHEHHS